MKYDLHLRIRQTGNTNYMYNKQKKNKSFLYVIRTMWSWFLNDNRTFDYTLSVRRHKR